MFSRLAILLLGGEPERDIFATKLAFAESASVPLKVFASSPGFGAEERLWPVEAAGQLVLSYEAVDTVTNFSTMIPKLLEAEVGKVLLVTSSYHMPRALAIADVMLSDKNITFEPMSVDSTQPLERQWKIWRDVLRARIWRCTGWDFRWLEKMLLFWRRPHDGTLVC
ncbi:unnamed protein product [Effrenium voratum]|uniref:DUF218 domain-containing protein n=1 Tax=Effrenium voratum TaxID=2562239 RepID=A0AA36NBI1_9DINO|nr:unnamed protein product [Effrenium voratum]CAJ1457313.1 unnamed protein product [Effrenium voratum]